MHLRSRAEGCEALFTTQNMYIGIVIMNIKNVDDDLVDRFREKIREGGRKTSHRWKVFTI